MRVYEMWFNLDKYFQMDAVIGRQNQPGDDRRLFIRARMSRLKWNISHYGNGKRVYKYRLFDDTRSAAGVWDGDWSPDIFPDREWEP